MNTTAHAAVISLVADFQVKHAAAAAQYEVGCFPRGEFRRAWVSETAARLASLPNRETAAMITALGAWCARLGADDLARVDFAATAAAHALAAVRAA